MKKIYITEQQYKILTEQNSENTMLFWHGGNLDTLNQDFKQKTGRYEYGPGLYLTTQYSDAVRYAKGNRKLYQVEIEKGIDLSDSKIPIENTIDFIKKYCIKSKISEILPRINKYSETGFVPGFVFNNLIINFEALKPTNTNNLKQFYINNGIDYEIVDNAFGWGEKMIVLYNTKKIINIKRVTPKDKIEKYNLHESTDSLNNELRQASVQMTNDIPKLFKEKVDEYLKTKELVEFEMNGVKLFIYDSSINKTPTSTPIYPKYVYLNVDYLSDFPKISLMGNNNIYIDLYFAFLHEFEHIENKIPPESMPDMDYQKYINSKPEKLAMEYSGAWLGQYTEPIYKKHNQVENNQ